MEVRSEYLLPSLQGLTLDEARSLILPHILRFITSTPEPEHTRNIVVLVDATNNIISFLEDRPINATPILEGLLPASKASIEAMPMVKVLDEGIDCSICLLDFESGEEAKEMPCKHRFHSICIDKWLGINGSCPICRYKMPVDEQCEKKDEESGDDERGDDDGDSDMEEDRVMFVFDVVVRPDSRGLIVSISEVHRHSDDVSIGAGNGDVFEADGDANESEAGDGGDDDESAAQDMVIDNN
ncbi:uncharacterized protein LOC129872572 [Solanum dulcamara]|uniref:uncharacterized protein LOC129872572 n=1 Tax=Solanum dulcamara TaxID=45834 RepID=UPI002485BC6A|nr:uncharacterized protein LOC129872572 [Solanum dulcamara]